MHEILLVFTAIIFYFIGRFSGHETELVDKARRKIKRMANPPAFGPIDYPTGDREDYVGSVEEAIDDSMVSAARKAGIQL